MFEQALTGVRVLDLTHFMTGPYCTKLLADYGADVIKVEKPGDGDGARRLGPFLNNEPHPEKSGLFAYLNTNKRGITLNLKSETGKRILLELVRNSDVLVENFAPRVMAGLGLGYEVLSDVNPRLVMVSISNFGQTGPYRDFRASEVVLNAMGGEMYSRGLASREPLKLGGNVVQYQAGTIAALSATIALWSAGATGRGDHLDLSIFDTQISSIDLRGANIVGYQYSRRVARRYIPGSMPLAYPNDVYMCKDGYIHITGGLEFWDRIQLMLGYPEEVSDPRMGTAEGQADVDLKGVFDAYFIPWCLERTKQELFLKGQAGKVLIGPVNTMEDVLDDSQFNARDFFSEVEHPVMGKLTIPGAPFRMQDSPWVARRPAPTLGQHNEEILRSVGYDRSDLPLLREAGVI